jgi:hypothetical protein
MTSYCTPDDVRKLIGLSTISSDPDYINDNDLQYYINKACTLLLEDFSIQIIEESMDGEINGSNTTFSVSNTPIADINFDSKIDSLDVTVYTIGDIDDPSTKNTVSVSKVYPYEGYIVLQNAPSSTIDDIVCTYRYYMSETINFSLLPLANAYLAGYLFITSEYLLIPEQYAVGAMRYTHRIHPISKIYETYLRIKDLITTKKWSKKEVSNIELLRG